MTTGQQEQTHTFVERKAKVDRVRRASSAAYLGPAWLLLLAIVLIPLALGLWISLRNGSLLTPTSKLVGVKNYQQLLASQSFWDSVKTTATISVLSLAIQLPVGFFLAVVWGGQRCLDNFLQTRRGLPRSI